MLTILSYIAVFALGFWVHIICVRLERAEANINRIFEEESDRQERLYFDGDITNENPMNE